MGLIDFFLLLLVAGVAGGIAQSLVGYSRGGCLVSIALGFVGALLGTWLGRTLGVAELFALRIGDVAFPIVWSIIGATVFVAILSAIANVRRPPMQ
jgi:uncharacterized membrane protein YeaQ/YmgE (transglycosylase-associated protein family)